MPRFIGRQGKNRMKSYRQTKRIEAELRNEEYQANKRIKEAKGE
jgi:hypothetical protein